ncbi:MAG: T9SS type A sorting domain-containing protein, partial [Flavobacteriales bacterium]|nr:T9SS type A sorting domain-containing protein [Flavobacteriales bacterium]
YSPDTDSRFMAGIAMNEVGDISLFYNVTSSSTFPGIRYTGRLANDPLGQMTLAEVSIVEGSGSNGSNRYGDYNSLDVDPTDGITFWGTSNYNPSSDWSTRIAAYSFSALNCTAPTVTSSVVENCSTGEFDASINIGADGDTTFYNVTVFSETDTTFYPLVAPGDLAIGTYAIGSFVDVLVEYPGDPACNRAISGITADGTSCCTAPTVAVTTTPDCDNGIFDITIVIGDDGDAPDYDVFTTVDGTATFIGNYGVGEHSLGNYPLGQEVAITIEHTGFAYCDQTIAGVTESAICNDECSGALPIACGGTVSGTTIGANVESPDPGFCGTSAGTGGGVWYRFTGQNSDNPSAPAGSTGDAIQLSTCNDGGITPGSTDYDTKLRVYSGDCASLTCVAGIDDFTSQCSGFSSLLDFDTQVGVEYFILVHGYSGSEGNFVLSMECTPPPACAEPSDLTATAETTEATVSWNENGQSTSWDIEYGPAGFIQGNGTVVPGLNTTSYTISGLESNSSYDYYVRSNCPNGVDNSAWVFGSFNTQQSYCEGDPFTDSGNTTGTYQDNELITYNICPDNPGANVSITFTLVDIEVNTVGVGIQDGCWDFLTIYDGPDTSSPVLAQTLCGELDGDGGIPSDTTSLLQAGDMFTASNGCLTIVFDSDASVIEQGWIATVDCGTVTDPCELFDTAPVDLTKSQQPVPFPDGVIDRVQVKFYKDSPQVRYTAEDNAALDIEFWPIRDLVTNTPITNGDTSVIADRVKPGQDFFKWPVKFQRPDIEPNTRYRWRVRTKCQEGDFRVSPWSEEKIFNTPDFDPETGIYTPPPGMFDESSDIKSLVSDAELAVYPNPNDGQAITLDLDIEHVSTAMAYVRIVDLSGKLIHAELISMKEASRGMELTFQSDLVTGMYFISVEVDEQIYREKFVVK